ncbi:hypothetical protein LEP1GSC005_1390 [Leptospira santarosai str. ST188]|nr:hypothetical protein LEP1GSC005_1390 [Leptospira santarosai str. ST188]
MPSLKERLDIDLLEKHQAWHEARGMLSPPKMLNTNQLTANHLQSVSRSSDDRERFFKYIYGWNGIV